jgi:hypothetical protein
MKIATLLAGVLLSTPVLAAEPLTPLTDAQLDRITAGRFAIADTPGPANIGIFVNDNRQVGTLIDTLRVALPARGFTIATLAPANIGIFVNDNRQVGTLVDTLRVAHPARGFSTATLATANIGIFVNDNGQAGTLVGMPGFTTSGFSRQLAVTTSVPANIGIFGNDSGMLAR